MEIVYSGVTQVETMKFILSIKIKRFYDKMY